MAHLGLLIPGGPFFLSAVLRVPAVALEELGVEVREVDLPRGFNPSSQLADNGDFFDAVGVQIQTALNEGDWSEVTFVAKSIGTMILGAIGSALAVPDTVSALWLTPAFALDYVRDGAVACGWRSMIVSGTADPFYDAAATDVVVRELGAQELLVHGADHNLEASGDVAATLRALDELAAATSAFIGQG